MRAQGKPTYRSERQPAEPYPTHSSSTRIAVRRVAPLAELEPAAAAAAAAAAGAARRGWWQRRLDAAQRGARLGVAVGVADEGGAAVAEAAIGRALGVGQRAVAEPLRGALERTRRVIWRVGCHHRRWRPARCRPAREQH